MEAGAFSADLAPETLRRSNLGDLLAGSRVNLERPVTPVTRLSGHIVQGHVDGTGELLSLDPLGDDNWWLRIRIPAGLERYLVFKGSITIDGISLTVATRSNATSWRLRSSRILTGTLRSPTTGLGRALNLECDVIAKHVEKLDGCALRPFRG